MLAWALFFFVALGAQALLALLTIYLLLPKDRVCNDCDGETVLLRRDGRTRLIGLLFGGRIERRWCPTCGCERLARRIPPPSEPAARVRLARRGLDSER